MNKCIYEPIHGEMPNCSGACSRGEDRCVYYYIDEIWKIMNAWKKESGVTSAILWKYDHKRDKICLYTTRPGWFIGKNGERYNKYNAMLCQLNISYVKNGVEFIECDEFINGD